MNWLNLEIRRLRSPEYLGSDPVERATWLNLIAHCCEQENGGRIVGARGWKDRQWQQMCGVTAREVARATRLLAIEGEDILVWGYDSDKEAEVQELRARGSVRSERKAAAARENGAKGGRPKTEPAAVLAGASETQLETKPETEQKSEWETQREVTQDNPTETHRREVERKEKGKEEKGNLPPAAVAAGGRGGQDLTAGFDRFWTEYPKRVARPDAQRAWARQRCAELQETILAAVRRAGQSHDWRKEDGQYIPHPATWLNRRGWEDEVRTTPRPSRAAQPEHAHHGEDKL